MSEEYTQRDYALDDPDSVQSGGVTSAVNIKKHGITHRMSDLNWANDDPNPGHESDEAAIDGYCKGSRDTREPEDTADKWAAKFGDL